MRHEWEVVSEGPMETTDRMSVPSGWLYRVTTAVPAGNDDPTIFVTVTFVPSTVDPQNPEGL